MKIKTITSSSFINQAAGVLFIYGLSGINSLAAIMTNAAGETRPQIIDSHTARSVELFVDESRESSGIISQYERLKAQRCFGLRRFIRASLVIGTSVGIVTVSVLVIGIRHHLKGLFW